MNGFEILIELCNALHVKLISMASDNVYVYVKYEKKSNLNFVYCSLIMFVLDFECVSMHLLCSFMFDEI